MSASHPTSPSPEQPPARDTEPPANRAERRGHGKKKGPAPHGHGKVRGARFSGPAPRQYQARKGG
jgi:hypothetical protein